MIFEDMINEDRNGTVWNTLSRLSSRFVLANNLYRAIGYDKIIRGRSPQKDGTAGTGPDAPVI